MAHNEKDFIYVVPKIKYIEVLDKNIGEYSILSSDGKDLNFEMRNFLNGKIFFNVPNGNYILKKIMTTMKSIFLLKKMTIGKK